MNQHELHDWFDRRVREGGFKFGAISNLTTSMEGFSYETHFELEGITPEHALLRIPLADEQKAKWAFRNQEDRDEFVTWMGATPIDLPERTGTEMKEGECRPLCAKELEEHVRYTTTTRRAMRAFGVLTLLPIVAAVALLPTAGAMEILMLLAAAVIPGVLTGVTRGHLRWCEAYRATLESTLAQTKPDSPGA